MRICVAAALVVGGLACSYIAAAVGQQFRAPHVLPIELLQASASSRTNVLDLIEFRLRLTSGVVVMPVFAVVGFTLVLWLGTRSHSRSVGDAA